MNHDEEDVDALDLYGHIIEEVLAGRAEGHKCPACGDGVLACTLDETRIVLKCPSCGRFFEGRLA